MPRVLLELNFDIEVQAGVGELIPLCFTKNQGVMAGPIRGGARVGKTGVRNTGSGQGTHFRGCRGSCGSQAAAGGGGAGAGAAGQLYFSLHPVDLWVMSLQPVMPKDDHVGLSLPQQEVDLLLVVSNHH